MNYIQIPNVCVRKHIMPTIYLDSCAMIELARYKNGKCIDAHKKEIEELYALLASMMQEKRILCPLGNQLQEMGMTKDREKAKLFLYEFTNSEFRHPDIVRNKQLSVGYKTYIGKKKTVVLESSVAFREDKNLGSPFVIHVAPVYSAEKAESLRQEKNHIVDILNEMKTSKKIKEDFNSQLQAELESEYVLFMKNVVDNSLSSETDIGNYADEITSFYQITGLDSSSLPEKHAEGAVSYVEFLLGPYHDLLPYIWIRASLWAHLMQRPNRIVRGDNLDVQWAAAYLPFANYAVTDGAFCKLLQESGLADLYGTKVYSLRTLNTLIDELKNIDK